uniref:Uncharacterized protein n=1 Tax=Glossina pallidipes TaxID=7398 RepID=A0A1B0A017_GLOPL
MKGRENTTPRLPMMMMMMMMMILISMDGFLITDLYLGARLNGLKANEFIGIAHMCLPIKHFAESQLGITMCILTNIILKFIPSRRLQQLSTQETIGFILCDLFIYEKYSFNISLGSSSRVIHTNYMQINYHRNDNQKLDSGRKYSLSLLTIPFRSTIIHVCVLDSAAMNTICASITC